MTHGTLPQWVADFYEGSVGTATRDELKILIEQALNLLKNRAYADMNFILENVDVTRLSPELSMGFARVLYPAHNQLEAWKDYIARTVAELDRRGLPAKQIMVGLL